MAFSAPALNLGVDGLCTEARELRKMCLRNFKCFCMAFMHPDWFDVEFHGKMCDFLQFGEHSSTGPTGVNTLDKLIVAPRTHLKTTLIEHFALWLATRRPDYERIFIVSNSKTNAQKTVGEIKGIIERHPRYQALFPDRIPDFSRRWSNDSACIRRKIDFADATFEAFGVGSNIIRGHCTCLVEDDTVAPKGKELKGIEVMPSRLEMEIGIGFHKLARPLLIDQDRDRRVFIGTRWAFYDVIQHILDNEAKSEVGRFYQIYDIPALDPDTGKANYMRFSEASLASIKETMGSFMYNALYLNNPMQSEQMKIRPAWIRFYEDSMLHELEGLTAVTVDPADPPSGRSDQCYTAAVSAKHTNRGLFVLRYRRGRYTDAEIIKHTFDIADIDNADIIRIEADRYPHLANAFRMEMARRNKVYAIEEVKTRGRSKDARIMRIAAHAENGLIWLRKGMDELETELYQYPLGSTNDIIDALAWHITDFEPLPDIKAYKRPQDAHNYREVSYEHLVEKLNHRPRQSRFYRN